MQLLMDILLLLFLPIMTLAQDVDPCSVTPCQNNATCSTHPGMMFTCTCPPPYVGDFCQNKVECLHGWYYEIDTRTCQRCPIGTYNPVPGMIQHCVLCPQDEMGHNSTTVADGTTNVTDCIFEPYIREIQPEFGPIAGGTLVSIAIAHTTNKTEFDIVYLIENVCDIMSNYTLNLTTKVVVCVTPNVTNTTSGPLIVSLYEGMDLIAPSNFTYRPNPIIEDVYPLKTFISGGLTLTITGTNLDSVAVPGLDVIREHHGRKVIFQQNCSIFDSDELHCPIPNLSSGLIHSMFGERTSLNSRNMSSNIKYKRSVHPASHNQHSESRDIVTLVSRPRVKRDSPTFNNEDTRFYLGAKLDGVDGYQNFSESLPNIGQLLVYPDPVYHPFDTSNQIRRYKTTREEYIHIKGQYLDYASDANDVTVTVGVEPCNVTFLATNLLSCRPPLEQPLADDSGAGPGNLPRVTVYVGSLTYVIGFMKYVTTPGISDVILGIIVAVLLVIIIVVLATICFICKRRRKSRKISRLHVTSVQPNDYQRHSSIHTVRPMSVAVSAPTQLNPISRVSMNPAEPLWPSGQYLSARTSLTFDVLDVIDIDLRMTLEDCQLDERRLKLKEVIGQGYFGKVYKGELKSNKDQAAPLDVAVKTVQGSQCSIEDVVSFLREAVMMRDFNHSNVLSLLGVIVKGNKPYVVLPFMQYGDLKTYIADCSKVIKVRELLTFGVHIAAGMEYLSLHKFVHRDLATRNCMVNTDMIVKIADFGLSRDIYNTDYYKMDDKRKPLPVKWMALESLQAGLYTVKSDVWSYGVVLWELLTRGCTPYSDVDSFCIRQYLETGRRLPHPQHAPDQIYELMLSCWDATPDKRPSFTVISQYISSVLTPNVYINHPDYIANVQPAAR